VVMIKRFEDIKAWQDVGYFAQGEFQSLYKMAEELTSLIGGFSTYLRRTPKVPTE
jgi:hypothetical protein